MPYDDLEISCDANVWNGEAVEYLFDHREGASELKFKASKFNSKRINNVDINIRVKPGKLPIWISHYGLKSANHSPGPGNDPKHW